MFELDYILTQLVTLFRPVLTRMFDASFWVQFVRSSQQTSHYPTSRNTGQIGQVWDDFAAPTWHSFQDTRLETLTSKPATWCNYSCFIHFVLQEPILQSLNHLEKTEIKLPTKRSIYGFFPTALRQLQEDPRHQIFPNPSYITQSFYWRELIKCELKT